MNLLNSFCKLFWETHHEAVVVTLKLLATRADIDQKLGQRWYPETQQPEDSTRAALGKSLDPSFLLD